MTVNSNGILNQRFDSFLYSIYYFDKNIYDRIFDVFLGKVDASISLYQILEKHYESEHSDEHYGGYLFRQNAHKIDFENKDIALLVHEHLGRYSVKCILNLLSSFNLIEIVETVKKRAINLDHKL